MHSAVVFTANLLTIRNEGTFVDIFWYAEPQVLLHFIISDVDARSVMRRREDLQARSQETVFGCDGIAVLERLRDGSCVK